MNTQSFFSKYRAIYRFHRPFGLWEALSRMRSIFFELDVFDFKHKTNTRTVKYTVFSNTNYMHYVPAFTSVVKEMLMFSYNHYISSIKYSDHNRKAIFVDFGAGLFKTPIIAGELGKFALVGGIEIDPELVEVATINISRISFRDTPCLVKVGNVEVEADIDSLVSEISRHGIRPLESTIFVFNKNSYGRPTLVKSLENIEKHFVSIVYLYQNPIHGDVLLKRGYLQFGQDDRRSTAHKNYKYNLYFKHNAIEHEI